MIIGGRREEAIGSELLIFGWPLTVYGKLGQTAVGTHERGLFITFPTLADMRATMQQICGSKAPLEPDRISGVLLELAPGAKTQQVRFSVLANFPGVKVVSGDYGFAWWGARTDGNHVRQHRADGERPVLGNHHRASA